MAAGSSESPSRVGEEAFTLGNARIDNDEIQLYNKDGTPLVPGIRGTPLGIGVFGTVWRGKCRGCWVAVKIPNRQRLSAAQMKGFLAEMEIMKKFSNPHCCLFMGAVVDETARQVKIVTELCEGDMSKLILQQLDATYPLSQRLGWALQAARGLAWLHGMRPNPILHRDLKLANILHDAELNIRVADFGLSQVTERGEEVWEKNRRGSLLYMAPEVYQCNHPISDRSDVYSFALVLWEFCARTEVFDDYFSPDDFVRDSFINGKRPALDPAWPQRLQDLMTRMWQLLPADRPPMCDVVNELELALEDVRTGERVKAVTDAIRDPVARDFWLTNYLMLDSVPIDRFMIDLYARQGLHLPPKGDSQSASITPEQATRHCFEIAVAEGKSSVEIEKFGKLIGWLRRMEPAGGEFLARLTALMQCGWFHGGMATETACNRLSVLHPGSFLVRFSNRTYGAYAISFVTSDPATAHRSIFLTDNGYQLDDPSYPNTYQTIPELIAEIGGVEGGEFTTGVDNQSWTYLFRRVVAHSLGYIHDRDQRFGLVDSSLESLTSSKNR